MFQNITDACSNVEYILYTNEYYIIHSLELISDEGAAELFATIYTL